MARLTPPPPRLSPLSALLSALRYDHGIDIWSVGCILAECLGRKALLPGRDYLQQLRLIIETLGAPAPENLKFIENPQAVEYIQNLPKKAAVPFKTLYPNANAHAIDLLEKMLVFNPNGTSAAEGMHCAPSRRRVLLLLLLLLLLLPTPSLHTAGGWLLALLLHRRPSKPPHLLLRRPYHRRRGAAASLPRGAAQRQRRAVGARLRFRDGGAKHHRKRLARSDLAAVDEIPPDARAHARLLHADVRATLAHGGGGSGGGGDIAVALAAALATSAEWPRSAHAFCSITRHVSRVGVGLTRANNNDGWSGVARRAQWVAAGIEARAVSPQA